LYNSPVSGIDNIYALDVKSGNRFQITCSKYGAYNPVVSKDGKWIYYNDQGRDGMDVVKIQFILLTGEDGHSVSSRKIISATCFSRRGILQCSTICLANNMRQSVIIDGRG